MRILFIANTGESLGVEYLSAYLKKQGHVVSLVFDPMLFRDYFFTNTALSRIFNMRESIAEEAVKYCPDVVLFSVLSGTYRWSVELAGSIKRRTKAVVIFGGIHPTSVPEVVLRNNVVDFVGVGECEEALPELIECLVRDKDPTGIRNFWMRRNGRVVANPPRPLIENLDELLFPDKGIFHEKYHALVDQNYMIATGRGCPYRCSFCYNSYIKTIYPANKYYRKRTINNVIEELKQAKEKFNIKSVYFVDDIFTQDIKILREFTERYCDEIKLPFRCEVMPKTINEEAAGLLKKAGCNIVNMGVQTIDYNLRKQILNRVESNDDIKRAIVLLNRERISIHANIILGIPGQDKDEWLNIANFFNQYKVTLVLVHWLVYYPRTEIINKAIEYGILNEDKIKKLEAEPWPINAFSETGSFANKIGQEYANLIALSPHLTKPVFKFIVRNKVFNYLPNSIIKLLNIYIVGILPVLSCIIRGKRDKYAYKKVVYLYYYFYFLKKFFLMKINKSCFN